jgi:hypothetical protein
VGVVTRCTILIMNGRGFIYESSLLANSIDIAACSIGFCLFLPVYQIKCGLKGKKKWGGHGCPGRCASTPLEWFKI